MPPLEKPPDTIHSSYPTNERRDDSEGLQTTPLKGIKMIQSTSSPFSSAIRAEMDERDEISSSAKKTFFNFGSHRKASFSEKSTSRNLNDSVHSEISIADEMKKKLFELNESQTEMEITYLNTISNLSAENDQAKNELGDMKNETERLSETNKVLESKLMELEEELNVLKKKTSDSSFDNHIFSSLSDDTSLLSRTSKPAEVLNRGKPIESLRAADMNTDIGSVKSGSSQRSSLSDIRMQFSHQRLSLSIDGSEIRSSDHKALKWEFQFYNVLKQNQELKEKILEAKRIRQELELKLEEKTVKFQQDVQAYKDEIETLRMASQEHTSRHELKEIEVRVPIADDDSQRNATEEKISDLQMILDDHKGQILRVTAELESKKTLESEIAVLRRGLESVKVQLEEKTKEAEDYKNSLDVLRVDFITTQERNASTFEELEEIRELYEAEVAKSTSLEKVLDVIDQTQSNHKDNILDNELRDLRYRLAEKELQLQKLQETQANAEKTLEDEVLMLTAERNAIEEELSACDESSSKDKDKLQMALETNHEQLKNAVHTKDTLVEDLEKQLMVVKHERENMMDELRQKNDEVLKLKQECSKSNSQLVVMENDIKTIQKRNSRTCEELDELREQFAIEVQQKMKLKEQLEHSSPDEILKNAKKENEEKLAVKDNEIQDLMTQLNKAKESRNKLELKLVDVMNDAVVTQSTRNLMKADLEMKLKEENEKAVELEKLIEEKETEIKRLTTEFDIFRIEMKKEMYRRREEISDLNGEVVEKATLLSSKEREFLQFKSEMEEMKLRHRAELEELLRQIDEFGSNENEMASLRQSNRRLKNDVSILKTELQRLTVSRTAALTPDSSSKVLRARNEQLVNTVERLNEKIKRIKRNVTLVEL